MARKIDSNFTGLRFTQEVEDQAGVLPSELDPGDPKYVAAPSWAELEPNSYSDFGSTVTTTARTPITAGRQRKKGRVTDLEAQAGFTLDFTGNNMVPLMPNYMFADWRNSAAPAAVNLGAITSAADKYAKAGAFGGFQAGHLVLAKGFAVTANNGVKVVTAATAADITIGAGLADEANPPDAAGVQVVGFQFDAAEVTIDVTDPAKPKLVSSGQDLTTLGLNEGQWVWIGGDLAGERFAQAGNNGAARIAAGGITATAITFDKTQNTMAADAGAGKTIRVYYGQFIKNEADPTLIKVKTIQLERSLSSAGYEYVKGNYANELTLSMPSADKITVELGFVSLDHEPRSARKAGVFPALDTDPEAFNTSSDFVRIRCSRQDSAAPLFANLQEMSLSINNNVTTLKALGVMGAFDASIGDFVVSGDMTAYFNDIEAVKAVRNSDSLSIDFMLAFDNKGWVFDVPLFTGSDGLLNVEKDQAITIPVGVEAAEDEGLHTTLIVCYFPYLPAVASS